MNNYKKILVCLLVFVTIFSVTGCQSKKEDFLELYKYTFRLAEAHPIDHPTTQADFEFAKRVEEESKGRIKIIVFPNKKLGEEESIIEQVGFGAIDFARVSIAPLSEHVNELNVLQLPYLYKNSEHMWKVLESDIGDYFLNKMSEKGYYGLTWFDAGARSFYTNKKPIKSLADLKGQTIRVPESSLMQDIIEALGAKSVMLSYGQVYSALQTGIIDGAENNFSSYVTASHLEVAKYFTVDEHVRVPEVLMASENVKEFLSEDDWNLLTKVALETKEYQKQRWNELDQKAKETMEADGISIYYLEDRSEFIEAVKPIYEEYSQYNVLIKRIKDFAD